MNCPLERIRLFNGMLLVSPHQTLTGALALRVNLKSAFEVSDAGMWLGNCSKDQPGIFHVRRQRGGNLRPSPSGMFITMLQGIDGLFQGLAG